jgi:hypothetical protein
VNRGGRPSTKTGSKTDPVSREITLAEMGIDKHLADRARKACRMSSEEFEASIRQGREKILGRHAKSLNPEPRKRADGLARLLDAWRLATNEERVEFIEAVSR